MSYTLSRNLRLRVDSGLSANARYNLERIDLLGSTIQIDTTEATKLRSRSALYIEPNSSALGGSGQGGSVYLGTESNPLDSLVINASNISFGDLGNVVTEDGTQTLVNKTMDFSQNTFLNFPGAAGLEGYSTTWVTADGLTKEVEHDLNSQAVGVFLIDLSDNSVSMVNSITIIDNNSISLTASELPGASGWRVVVFAV